MLCKLGLGWRVGLVRIHDDAERVPGAYGRTVVVFVIGKTYELMGLCEPIPTRDEFRHFYSHLKSLGLRKTYRRAKKDGEMYEVA